MPIPFIVSGIVFLLVLFDCINISDNFNKTNTLVFTSCLCFSYFFKMTSFGDMYVNLIQLFLIFLLLIILFKNNFKNVAIYILALLTLIVSYIILKTSPQFLLSKNASVFEIIVITISLLFVNHYESGLLYIVLSYILVGTLNVIFEMGEYTFSSIIINLCFEMILIFSLVYIIYAQIKNLASIGRKYEKINFNGNVSNAYFINLFGKWQ